MTRIYGELFVSVGSEVGQRRAVAGLRELIELLLNHQPRPLHIQVGPLILSTEREQRLFIQSIAEAIAIALMK